MTEFNLSEKETYVKCILNCSTGIEERTYWKNVKDIKEAVKKLKEVMRNKKVNANKIMEKPHIMFDLMIEEIDKIFGEKLK